MQGASLFREFIPCDGRKRTSVQENVLDTQWALQSRSWIPIRIGRPWFHLIPIILNESFTHVSSYWLPEPSIQLCNDLTITRTCLLADTFDPTITGEEPVHETHRTLVLHVSDSNQTEVLESPLLVSAWFIGGAIQPRPVQFRCRILTTP